MPKELSNPLDLYNSLSNLSSKDANAVYFAHLIPNRKNDYLARGEDNQPAILFLLDNQENKNSPSPIRLEHLQVDHGLECKIKLPSGKTITEVFSIIRCVNANKALQEYFLRIIFPIIQGLPIKPNHNEIFNSISLLVDLFRSLSVPSKKTIQGLWAELFLMESSLTPKNMIDAWHSAPTDRYDFNSSAERIEVKSSSGRHRVHNFSFEQLNPPIDVNLLIASVFVEETAKGKAYLI